MFWVGRSLLSTGELEGERWGRNKGRDGEEERGGLTKERVTRKRVESNERDRKSEE